mmetsp:Transcript_2680/g.10255  ORF Transcript_2680/g.10255 Transcript_2680/m.10255 type:complete len:122 (+) Transcript_2680:297-662(+)
MDFPSAERTQTGTALMFVVICVGVNSGVSLEHAPRSAHDCATSASAPSPFGRDISCSVEDARAVEFRPHAGNTAGLGWETKRTDDTRNGDGERLRDGKLAMTNPARRKQALGRTRLWVVAA